MSSSIEANNLPGRPWQIDNLPVIALGILGVVFAFEATDPLLAIKNVMVFTNIEFLIVVVAATWLVALLKRRRRPFAPSLVIVPALAWIAVLLASTISAPGQPQVLMALRFSGRMLSTILLGWICYDTVVSSKRPGWIACCLAAGGCLVAALGLAEALNIPAIAPWLSNFKFAPTRVGDILRISSTLSYATIAAMVLELTFPLLLAWFITAKSVALKAILGVAGVLYLVALVLTLSRAGVVALGAALLVVVAAAFLTDRRRMALAPLGAMGVLGVLALLSLVFNPDLGLRLTSENDSSWYDAGLSAAGTLTAQPGDTVTVPITLTNRGAIAWDATPEHQFAVGYHLYGSDRSVITYDGARTPIPGTVAPGAVVVINASLVAPARPDTYDVEWDVVQEGVAWFSWKGSSTTATKLIVSGSPHAGADVHYVPPPQDILTLPTPGRLQLWSAGFAMLRDHPVLGVGPDNFRWLYGLYAGASRWNTEIHANNLYVELLADTGVLGFIAYMWLAWRIVSQSTSGLWRRQSGSLWIWRVAALASLITWFVHGLFDYFYEFTPTYVAFSMIAGLALGMAALDTQETHATANADRI